jgi:hypothetical protein
VNSNWRAIWIVTGAACLFLLLGTLLIPRAGLEVDETLFAQPLYHRLSPDFELGILHHKVPMMIIAYIGAFKTLLCWPNHGAPESARFNFGLVALWLRDHLIEVHLGEFHSTLLPTRRQPGRPVFESWRFGGRGVHRYACRACYFRPMNPYAAHIGNQAPLDVISETPRHLAQLAETIGPERLETRPAPGKWSARDILCHLADCEVVFGFRLRQTLAEDHHVVQPFDQDRWAGGYGTYDANLALATFSAVREWNLALIRAASPADLAKAVTHPERGTMTFQTIVETMAGHDRNHMKQMEAIASQAASAR